MGTASALALLAVAACSSSRTATPEARLTAYLEHARTDEVSTWKLDRTTFREIVVDPFRDLYDDYATQFDAHRPALGPVAVRRHFANDPALTPVQARLRWALPVMYPSYAALDTVFVEAHGRWYALAGLDEAMLAHVRGLDGSCADHLALAGPAGSCTDAGWVVADAGLRGDSPRFAHACHLAATACSVR